MRRPLLSLLLALAAITVVPPASASAPAGEAALVGVRTVAAGVNHSCALLAGGGVRCWGDNGSGQLGNGNFADSTLPVVVTVSGNRPLSGATQVAAGHDTTCARMASTEVRCWGAGAVGQLGDGAGVVRTRPVVVSNPAGTGPLRNVRRVAVGASHACAVLLSGQVRCWGFNNAGQVGDGTSGTNRLRPVPVVGDGGTGRLTGVTQADADLQSTCARLAGGQARCWGANNSGQLGDGTTVASDHPVPVNDATGTGPLAGVAEVAISQAHGCARVTGGQARCWGFNGTGQIGDGAPGGTNLLPVVVQNPGGDGPLTGVTQLAAGGGHTCARLTTGQARCWGLGAEDQLGDGDGVHRALPVAVRNLADTAALANVRSVTAGLHHTCARLASGQVRCWGLNTSGQAGGPAAISHPLPVVVRIT